MIAYLTKLASDYDRVLEFLCTPLGEKAESKIVGRLIPGAKCAWCYEDDVEQWRKDGITYNPKDWPYQGFIVPFPETNGRTNDMEMEHVCLVVTDYPIEKENPVTDWSVLACLFQSADLHQFHVFDRKDRDERKRIRSQTKMY